MIAALLIWASQDEGSKQNNNQASPSIPEYLLVAWLCGNAPKFLIIVTVEYQHCCLFSYLCQNMFRL